MIVSSQLLFAVFIMVEIWTLCYYHSNTGKLKCFFIIARVWNCRLQMLPDVNSLFKQVNSLRTMLCRKWNTVAKAQLLALALLFSIAISPYIDVVKTQKSKHPLPSNISLSKGEKWTTTKLNIWEFRKTYNLNVQWWWFKQTMVYRALKMIRSAYTDVEGCPQHIVKETKQV